MSLGVMKDKSVKSYLTGIRTRYMRSFFQKRLDHWDFIIKRYIESQIEDLYMSVGVMKD